MKSIVASPTGTSVGAEELEEELLGVEVSKLEVELEEELLGAEVSELEVELVGVEVSELESTGVESSGVEGTSGVVSPLVSEVPCDGEEGLELEALCPPAAQESSIMVDKASNQDFFIVIASSFKEHLILRDSHQLRKYFFVRRTDTRTIGEKHQYILQEI